MQNGFWAHIHCKGQGQPSWYKCLHKVCRCPEMSNRNLWKLPVAALVAPDSKSHPLCLVSSVWHLSFSFFLWLHFNIRKHWIVPAEEAAGVVLKVLKNSYVLESFVLTLLGMFLSTRLHLAEVNVAFSTSGTQLLNVHGFPLRRPVDFTIFLSHQDQIQANGLWHWVC